MRKIIRRVANGMPSARTIEQTLTVSFEELANVLAVAMATSSTIVRSVARRPLLGATSREPFLKTYE